MATEMSDANGNVVRDLCHQSIAEQLRQSVQQYLEKNSEIVAKLEELSEAIGEHSSNCNIAKAVGTSVSGVGSVGAVAALGMAFAPITAGFSTVVAIGAGVTAGLGSVTTIGTVIVDSLKTKQFIKAIVALAQQKNKCVEDLREKFQEFSHILTVDDNYNMDSDINFISVMKTALSGGTEMFGLGKNSALMLDSIRELKAINAAKSTGNVSNSAKVVDSIRELNVLGAVNNGKNLLTDFVKNVMSFGAPAEKAGIDLFVKTTGPTVGKAVFKSASALAGVAFTVVDVISLVKDWNKHQPTIELIQELIDQLMNEAKLVVFHYNILTVDVFDDQLINDIIGFVGNCEQKTDDYNPIKTDTSLADNNSNSIILNENDCSVKYSCELNGN